MLNSNHQKSEVRSRLRSSLVSLELYVRFIADESIDMLVNNLDPLIQRYNALDRELGLNTQELEGRKAAEQLVYLQKRAAKLSRSEDLRMNSPWIKGCPRIVVEPFWFRVACIGDEGTQNLDIPKLPR